MNPRTLVGILLVAVVIGISPFLANPAYAQTHWMSPRAQWQTNSDVS